MGEKLKIPLKIVKNLVEIDKKFKFSGPDLNKNRNLGVFVCVCIMRMCACVILARVLLRVRDNRA